MSLDKYKIGVIIPCYKVEKQITKVLLSIPDFVDYIITIDDNSTDGTGLTIKKFQKENSKVQYIKHFCNQGVGGAVVTGFKKALELNCDFIVKLDGDGQMDPAYISDLVEPLINDNCQFSKGNRFTDFNALKKMPFIRRTGNLLLSFMVKGASGYWKVFDPTNGFFCIKRESLEMINLERLDKRYFFESSLIIELYYTGARIFDVPMPAKYGDEKSNLSVFHSSLKFPGKILKAFLRRVILEYFIYDFNIFSIYIITGFPLMLFGFLFGLINWIHYASSKIPAPTGTVMISVLSIVLGFQLLLSFIQYDITSGNPFELLFKNKKRK